jgi:membrane-associated phospholipid phosphatase
LRAEEAAPNAPLNALDTSVAKAEHRAPAWVPWAVGGGALLAVWLEDDNIHHATSKNGGDTINDWFDHGDFAKTGSVLDLLGQTQTTIAISGLFYMSGAWAHSEKAKFVGVAGTEAAVAGGLAVIAIKLMAGRNRPYTGSDADTFHFFRGSNTGHSSFPSGHTTTAFAMASVVADEYDNFWADFFSYGLAATVGFGRMYQDKHWASDVVAGAILGTTIGKAVCNWERRSGKMRRLYTDGRGIYLAQKF